MAEKILGPAGPARKRRLKLLWPLLLMCLIIAAIGAQSGAALDTTNPPSFTFVKDEDCSKTPACADDQPGQKDLSAHAVATPSQGDLWVAWKWDVLALSGGNTGDACALFDTDPSGSSGIGKVDFAVCVTIAADPAVQLDSVANPSPRIYTCGDAKVDRCTSTAALVQRPYGTACTVNQSGVDRTDPWHSGQQDTVAICHISLADVGGATVSRLVNTCSYPSQQPNSDPSDCVLIPRDAFLKIVKDAGGDTTTDFAFTVSGGATFTGNVKGSATGTDNSQTIPIKSSTATTVTETLPSADWTFTSATCVGGTNNGTAITNGRSGVQAASDTTVTCTFVNALKAAPQLKIEKSCPSGPHAAGDRFQPTNGGGNVGTALACGGDTTITLSPNTAYSIGEAAAGTTVLANYTVDTTDADCASTTGLARGAATPTCTIVNTLKAAPQLKIVKSCPDGKFADGDRFQATNGGSNVGDVLDCGGETTITLSPDTAYSIGEAAAGTTVLANYTVDKSDTDCASTTGLARGAATPTCTIVNTLRKFTVVTYVCEGSQLYESSVTFDGNTHLSLAHNATLPGGVTEAQLCADIAARFPGTKSGTKTGSVTITP